jgi:hypothetical protein
VDVGEPVDPRDLILELGMSDGSDEDEGPLRVPGRERLEEIPVQLVLEPARVSDPRPRDATQILHWRDWLGQLGSEGREAVVWGAGSKGTTFMNLFRDAGALSRVVDVNPHKEGMYISGTGHPIVYPNRLAEGGAPDFVLVMNPVYLQEIHETLKQLQIPSECLVV